MEGGGGGAKYKKNACKGRLNEKKFMHSEWPRKKFVHTEKKIPAGEKNSCSSKITHLTPPPHNFSNDRSLSFLRATVRSVLRFTKGEQGSWSHTGVKFKWPGRPT